MPEDRIVVEGLSIRYWTNTGGLEADDKNRRTIVLFHGNALSLDSWKKTRTLDELSSKGYRVFAIDLPAGKGSMSDKLSPRVLKNEPDRILIVLDKLFEALDVGDSPFAIVGPSMGGGFALAYALSRPNRVGAMILVSPSVCRIPEDEKRNLSGLDIPVLLVWGDRDRVFPLAEYGEPLKETLPRAKLLVVKQAGHGANLDKPDEFNGILLDFLSEVG
ncbi:MAG TPA: alpha/beta hydrolase [Nitrososphaerales archaeon]|nr:alpha/beta hydrolase [Nitrososphaerales archaeon]